jgi:hypothetical protein
MIGKPHHFLIDKTSACGLINPDYGTENRSDVNCYRCRKTLKFRREYVVENYNVIKCNSGKFTKDEAHKHLNKLIGI